MKFLYPTLLKLKCLIPLGQGSLDSERKKRSLNYNSNMFKSENMGYYMLENKSKYLVKKQENPQIFSDLSVFVIESHN
jgi:hypothetical protein